MGQWLSPIKTLKAAYTHVYVVFRVFFIGEKRKKCVKGKMPRKEKC